MNTEAEIVSTRTTFDGVTVHLHANGEISDRMYCVRGGRLPLATMWRAWSDVCVLTHAELPDFIRAAKRPAKKAAPVLRPYLGSGSYGVQPVGLMQDDAGNVYDCRPRRCRMVAPLAKTGR